MKRNAVVFFVVFSAMVLAPGLFADLGADSSTILSIRRASTEIRSLNLEPLPAGLDPIEIDYLTKTADLLLKLSGQLDAIAVKAGEAPLRDYSPMIQQVFDEFDLDFLRLQEKMRGENRKFTLVSNIMKNRRDAAQNAVNNIR